MNAKTARSLTWYAIRDMSYMSKIIKDTHGNVSQRFDEGFFIKPSGMNYVDVTEEDICEIGLDRPSNKKNIRTPSVDTTHHKTIYKNNKHIGAICHTHSPFATAYAAAGRHLDCYTTEQADYFGQPIFCLPYRDLDVWGNILLQNKDRAALLECHGVLTFADTAVEAVKLAAAVENIAEKNFYIETLTKSFRDVGLKSYGNDEIKKWHSRYMNVYGQKSNSSSE